MNRLCLWLADKLSLILEPRERAALSGDHAELRVSGALALKDVLGLVLRRQMELWKNWRPWLTLLALAFPLGVLLSLTSQGIASSSSVPLFIYVGNWTPAFLESPGSRSDLLRYAVSVGADYLILACWSWATGFLLGLISRRTIPVQGASFCLVGLLLSSRSGAGLFSATFPQLLQAGLVLLPSLWGICQGHSNATALPSRRRRLMALASATVAVLILRNWDLVLCAWGMTDSCRGWALQASHFNSFGLTQRLPMLGLSLIGPVGCLLDIAIARRKRLLMEETA